MNGKSNGKLFDKLDSIVGNLKGERLADVFRLISFAPMERYHEHHHHRIEINYVKRGSCIIHLPNESVSFSKDDLMVICSDVSHSFQSGSEGCVLLQLEFSPNVFLDFTNVLSAEGAESFTPLGLFSSSKSVIKIINNVHIMRALERIVSELNGQKPYYDYLVIMYYAELLILIYRHLDETYLPIGLNPAMRDAVNYIRQNFNKEITINKVACEVKISERYLRKIFAKYLNLSPIEYLNQLRVNYAVELLRAGEMSVKEISYESGFQSPQYFSRVFKKMVGISPSNIHFK